VEAIQNGFRAALKLLICTCLIAGYLVSALVIKFKLRRDPLARRRAFIENSHRYCRRMAKNLQIHTTVKGRPVAESNFLYVGNHMGFVDILAVSSIFPALFITSHEMRETPLLGTLCEMAGCLFVERRSRTRIINELDNLKEALEQGFNVVLYPEATSTNGEAVLPFKKTLMMAGPRARRPIQPGCINFHEINGEDFNLRSRDSVCWYGDMSFVAAMWNTFTASSIKVELEFLEPLLEGPEADRNHVALKAHSLVSSRFRPPRRHEAPKGEGLRTS